MNIKEIKEMINLMNENGLVELEIEKDGMRIRLKKTGAAGIDAANQPIIVERTRVSGEHPREESYETTEKTTGKTIEIKAPMVGTFYRAPSPEAPPYAEVGQVIEPGQVICIIEAMKLMNEIKSEVKGKVLEIFADNAEPVEFGQPMFLIEPL
ncbi:MAG: acetyl-CoA carboxylase biotin carboxyl carrier protein [Candidatus Omnitrophica bacterium]|nr:acetyl-CoA carboxylase biotin carboxyl carrier protein [Candidatus Omnitrophota bacterium]MDD5591733.1 acetyl-CoA carboxylase biotin carboxyl carrier protein [Candidatus Omnitrophota bacterium]